MKDATEKSQSPETTRPQPLDVIQSDIKERTRLELEKTKKNISKIVDDFHVKMLFIDEPALELLTRWYPEFSRLYDQEAITKILEANTGSNLDKLTASQMEQASQSLAEHNRALSRYSKEVKPYLALIDEMRIARNLEAECNKFIKNTLEIEKCLYYFYFKNGLDGLKNGLDRAESMQPGQFAEQILQFLTAKYTNLDNCFEEIKNDANDREDVKEALKEKNMNRLSGHINSFIKCQRPDLQEIGEHQSFRDFMGLYEKFKETFDKANSLYHSKWKRNSQSRAVESLYIAYVRLSNSFEKLAADTQKLRSESELTLDALRKRYSLPLCLSPDINNNFEKEAEKFWSRLYAHFKADITREHPHIQTIEEYRAAVAKKAADLVESAHVWTRCQPKALRKILDGRLKSQFETNTSGGRLNSKDRAEAEEVLSGYPENLDPTLRLIYGYITDDLDGKTKDVETYGTVAIRFKDSIKPRTTITTGDSLNSIFINERFVHKRPTLYTNLDEGIFARFTLVFDYHSTTYQPANPLNYSRFRDLQEFVKEQSDRGCVEAQLHGGVGAYDIAEIVFTDPEKPPSRELVKKLEEGAKQYNFTWRVVATSEPVGE